MAPGDELVRRGRGHDAGLAGAGLARREASGGACALCVAHQGA